MAFKPETKNILIIKKEIDNCSNEGRVLARHKVISRVETIMDIMKNKKEISGRGYGILIRYLRKKIPKEEPFYSDVGLIKRDGSLNLKKSTGKKQTMDELMSNLIND